MGKNQCDHGLSHVLKHLMSLMRIFLAFDNLLRNKPKLLSIPLFIAAAGCNVVVSHSFCICALKLVITLYIYYLLTIF